MVECMKICFLGDGAVGKTALIWQLMNDQFLEEYDPTIEDAYRVELKVDEQLCQLEILDAAGQEEFAVLWEQWVKHSDAFALVYDITRSKTLDQVVKLKGLIEKGRGSESIIIVVGNKCDKEQDRAVATSIGKDVANLLGCLFAETSAKYKQSIAKVIVKLVHAVRQARREKAQREEAKKRRGRSRSFRAYTIAKQKVKKGCVLS